MGTKQRLRSEIPNDAKWKLEDIFESDELWQQGYQNLKNEIPALFSYAGKIAMSAKMLLQFIRRMHEMEEILGKLYAYAHMRNDEDKSVAKYQEQYELMGTLLVEYNESISFFEPELLAIPKDQLKLFFENETELAPYRHFIDNIIRTKSHTLSANEERLLALSGEVRSAPAEIFGVWDSADIMFPKIKDEQGREVELTNALYGKYQQSPDRRLRKDSYMGLYEPFLSHRNMLATNFAAIIKSHVFESRARKYASTVEAALDANAIPVEIYYNLIESTKKNLAPLHRYNRLRKKILKLDDGLHDYDIRAPLFSSREKEYSWDEAVQLCLEGMKPLGDDYIKILKKSFDEGWIDVYENKGKCTGAYSSGTYGVHPYVLMNYNGTMSDVFTLAHEMGHALHTWYTINNQPFVYGDYPIFLAEVASTTNEGLLQKHLIANASGKKEKLAYLNSYLDKFSQTFYRQIIFAEFELRTHQMVEAGEALTADKLDDVFGSIYKSYHGPDFVLDRQTKALWSRVPHFYYNYYVFQYSTSFVASAALVARIDSGDKNAREQYLNFLKSGRCEYPVQTLQKAGVDLTKDEPVLLGINLMDQLLDEMENLIE